MALLVPHFTPPDPPQLWGHVHNSSSAAGDSHKVENLKNILDHFKYFERKRTGVRRRVLKAAFPADDWVFTCWKTKIQTLTMQTIKQAWLLPGARWAELAFPWIKPLWFYHMQADMQEHTCLM